MSENELDINIPIKHTSCAVPKLPHLPQVIDLSTSKWGSQITRVMSFLPANFRLATPFHSRLRVRHRIDRQTDRQTDNGHQYISPTMWGRGIIIGEGCDL